uniref:CSON001230 protein n=1 Tax=Culicoides sonorensis TaxID=179676 RepID=A0A336K4X3_CULSO
MSSNLMKTLFKMQQNRDETDCTFSFKDISSEKSEIKLIYTHRLILSATSPVFKTMLSEKWSKDESIEMSDVTFEVFEKLIKAIYTGHLDVEKLEETLELYSLAHLYQVSDVIKLLTNYMIKVCKYSTEVIIPFLNYACLYENLELKEACLKLIQEKPCEILKSEVFLTASTEVVKLIFSLDPLNIDTDEKLMNALDNYLKINPDSRTELEDAIYSIRFLTIDDEKIMECQFLNDDTKNHLVILKNNPDLPINILTDFSKNRNPRSAHLKIKTLPGNIVVKLYELFNDRHCFLCKAAHSSLSCPIVWTIFPPFTYLNRIYSNNYSHTCLERYSNDHITSILQAFKKLAVDEKENSRFGDFLDV